MNANPTFIGALRGIWLFTWRSQLTWQKTPMLLLSLLALPLLVYFTVLPPGARAPHSLWWGESNPVLQMSQFGRDLAASNHPLTTEQRVELHRIFKEEYQRADQGWLAAGAHSMSPDEQNHSVNACFDRIGQRAQTVLDPGQMEQWNLFSPAMIRKNQLRLTSVRWSQVAAFYHWLIDFYFFVILPLHCVRTSGGLIRDELQADTLGFLTTRPVSRARLIALKYFCQTVWIQILLLMEALLLFIAGYLLQIPGLAALIPLFLAAQFLAIPAWSALGTLLGQVTMRYMAVAMIYGLVVEMGIGRIPTNINALSLMRHLKTLLSNNTALQAVYQWPINNTLFSIGAVVVATGIFLSLAMLLFTFKEYHHTTEMQK